MGRVLLWFNTAFGGTRLWFDRAVLLAYLEVLVSVLNRLKPSTRELGLLLESGTPAYGGPMPGLEGARWVEGPDLTGRGRGIAAAWVLRAASGVTVARREADKTEWRFEVVEGP